MRLSRRTFFAEAAAATRASTIGRAASPSFLAQNDLQINKFEPKCELILLPHTNSAAPTDAAIEGREGAGAID